MQHIRVIIQVQNVQLLMQTIPVGSAVGSVVAFGPSVLLGSSKSLALSRATGASKPTFWSRDWLDASARSTQVLGSCTARPCKKVCSRTLSSRSFALDSCELKAESLT